MSKRDEPARAPERDELSDVLARLTRLEETLNTLRILTTLDALGSRVETLEIGFLRIKDYLLSQKRTAEEWNFSGSHPAVHGEQERNEP